MSVNSQHEQVFSHVFISGITNKRFDITIKNGVFSSIVESDESSASPLQPSDSGRDLWIAPGVIDLHTHLAWTDFDHDDQLKRDSQEIEALQAQAFEATLWTGVTSVRDAGGLSSATAERIRRHYAQPLSVHTCGDMLGAGDARGPEYLQQRVKEIVDSGATWVKILATGGLGSPSETVMNPVFAEEEFAAIVRAAHNLGVKVLVHAWGGPALDWSIRYGVASVEHGMFMTEDQAYRLAQSTTAFVPTVSIYRIAADPSSVLALNPVLCERAARAAEAHPNAVSYAKKAGVRMGFGTDYATPMLHGTNLDEWDALIDCGLTRAEAWQAATSAAADILGYGDSIGRIAEGFAADAIIFAADPYQAENARALQESIVTVMKGGVERR
ncbi:amidohydrolase family protein [Cohnella terricola]|uniref:Amidohydrolase family protein n=1 Tax=Cohnella terricola TaxID=1289167 RepID=A0A559J4V8_9BACL|nr:amidohydrolase family protein [Cohnella terricola]TVX94871.1 amidohydrolase family protein [Cohnella terricola]